MTAQTPILDRLVAHAVKARASLHVPGHHSGRLLPAPLSEWLGPAAKLDLTELPGLDNLAAPTDCIAASQELAAEWYGCDETMYCVGGSTQGVLAALYGTVPEGGTVLFLNPFHQSAWHALVIRNAWPETMPVAFNSTELCAEPPEADAVQQILANPRHKKVAAVYLTSPTYEGVVADVAAIAEIVHAFNLPLIVDEAHGAHLGLCAGLPPHSVACGADVVVQSVHKMLPGLTQTAWVHVQGSRINRQRISKALRLFQTTSPSYLLLASLDVAQSWLRTAGPAAAEQTLQQLAAASLLPGQHRRTEDHQAAGMKRDPLKLWLPTGAIERSRAIAADLARDGIDVEYANPQGVLMLPGFTPPNWLLARLQQVFETEPEPIANEITRMLPQTALHLELSPRAVNEAATQRVPLEEAVGRLAGSMVTPYPPGVPVVYPGQMITLDMVDALTSWQASGYPVHGLAEGGQISVVVE